MYGFWGIILLTGILNRLFKAVVQWKIGQANFGGRQLVKRRLSGPRRWIQKHITLPAAFGYRHQQALGWCTVPTRIQSLMVLIFIAINAILCAVTYRAFDRNI